MIIQGDCITKLKELPDESVNCCITSPPYWGLRDYGTAKWEGGSAECDHIETLNKHGGQRADRNQEGYKKFYQNICGKCGAKRIDLQLGLEKTPEECVKNMVEVFREVKRVLKKEGTLWLNLGDSYWGGGNNRGNKSPISDKQNSNTGATGQCAYHQKNIGKHETIKPKDLVGIPWMTAFALRADGWYLRQDIIWHKPNPMPESVRDRCTKAHEYVFLMSKNKKYYYDNEAIKESSKDPESHRGRNQRSAMTNESKNKLKEYGATRSGFKNIKQGKTYPKRNKRSVWKIATKPFKEAHFATFPEKLIEPMVKAGCPKGGTVLDPFFGSGTVGVVAKKLNRKYIGIELNPEYIKIAKKRINENRTLFDEENL
jgi:DNA modification methylase